jgi:hypothetical protein
MKKDKKIKRYSWGSIVFGFFVFILCLLGSGGTALAGGPGPDPCLAEPWPSITSLYADQNPAGYTVSPPYIVPNGWGTNIHWSSNADGCLLYDPSSWYCQFLGEGGSGCGYTIYGGGPSGSIPTGAIFYNSPLNLELDCSTQGAGTLGNDADGNQIWICGNQTATATVSVYAYMTITDSGSYTCNCDASIPANSAACSAPSWASGGDAGYTPWYYVAGCAGAQCSFQCNAGTNWNGSACIAVPPPSPCTNPFTGASVPNGGSVTAYDMPSGCSCGSQTSICTNGAFVPAITKPDQTCPSQLLNGSCGSDSGKTLPGAPTNYCSPGTVSNLSGPGAGGLWTWTCNGSCGGSPSGQCSATQKTPPAYIEVAP